MLLGWIAGTMAYSDPGLSGWIEPSITLQYVAGAVGGSAGAGFGAYPSKPRATYIGATKTSAMSGTSTLETPASANVGARPGFVGLAFCWCLLLFRRLVRGKQSEFPIDGGFGDGLVRRGWRSWWLRWYYRTSHGLVGALERRYCLILPAPAHPKQPIWSHASLIAIDDKASCLGRWPWRRDIQHQTDRFVGCS